MNKNNSSDMMLVGFATLFLVVVGLWIGIIKFFSLFLNWVRHL